MSSNARRRAVEHKNTKTPSQTSQIVLPDAGDEEGDEETATDNDVRHETDQENDAIMAILNENTPEVGNNIKERKSHPTPSNQAPDGQDKELNTARVDKQDDTTVDGNVFRVSKPQTMQEYVEKFYMPPSRISIASRQLPTIAEKSQRLVESILNYRHVLGSREKSESHKSR